MPAQHLFSHVFNKAVEDRNLFNTHADYEVFISYLKQYLSPPATAESVKKEFSVKGRTFRGVPHQTKNYYNKVELAAYSLMPDHFHLVIREVSEGTIEKLIRSLCIRYAIYYNKKYLRAGSLFVGPYKSVSLKDSQLLLLSLYIHRESLEMSSYKYFLQAKECLWLKPTAILSQLDNPSDYKYFIENYEPNQSEKEILSHLIFEKPEGYTDKPKQSFANEYIGKKSILEAEAKHSQTNTKAIKPLKSRSRKPEFFALSISSFMLLLVLGLKSIMLSELETSGPSLIRQPTPAVAGSESEEQVSPTPTPTPTRTPTPSLRLTPSLTPTIIEEKNSEGIP